MARETKAQLGIRVKELKRANSSLTRSNAQLKTNSVRYKKELEQQKAQTAELKRELSISEAKAAAADSINKTLRDKISVLRADNEAKISSIVKFRRSPWWKKISFKFE